MRKIVSFLVAAVFVLGASAVSMAGARGINSREYREQQRINQGIRSGELTRREAVRLEQGMAKIRTDERYARLSGGGISPRERARHAARQEQHRVLPVFSGTPKGALHEINRESRAIYRQKYDGQDRNP